MTVGFDITRLHDIDLIGVTDCAPTWRLMPRIITDYEIIVCVRGNLRFQMDGRQYTMNPGDFILIPPHKTHAASVCGSSPAGFYYLHFTPAGTPDFMEDNQVEAQIRQAEEEVMRELREDMFFILPSSRFNAVFIPVFLPLGNSMDAVLTLFERALYERNVLTVSSKAMISLYLSQILLIISRVSLQARRLHPVLSKAGELPRQLQAVIHHIYNHWEAPIKITDLCREFGISQQYLCRLFAKHLSMSPVKYINRIKIGMAKDLMRRTDMRVKQIASACGFQNDYYFSRVFRQVEGISPTEYASKLDNKSNG